MLTILALYVTPARAGWLLATPPDGAACDAAIAATERARGLPPGLLGAIGRVESGRRDPLSGALAPWPWTIDVEGEGHSYATAAQAIAAVRGYQAAGRRSIDVGCMQINLVQHPDAFASLDAAFDPATNVGYAADFLQRLHDAAGDWTVATGQYHSATPALALPYRARVAALMGSVAPGPDLAWASRPAPIAMPLRPFGSSPIVGGLALRGMAVSRVGGLAAPPGAGVPAGHDLASYRARPVQLALR